MSTSVASTSLAPPSARSQDSLAFLDGLRGLAAVWVMLHHARWLLWEGWESFRQHAGDYSAVHQALAYALAPLRYGHQAVIFFFVLSGFVIHLGYARKLVTAPETARLGWANYVWRRARRLYPPLLLALALTWVLDSLGRAQGWTIYAGTTAYPLINGTVTSDLSVLTALGNAAFLMTSAVPCFGSNGPLWSLHFEWWFYMVYPLLWVLARRSLALASGFVIVAFALSWLAPDGVWFYVARIFTALLSWWLGALLAEIYEGRWRIRWSTVAPLALLLPALPILLPKLAKWWPPIDIGWISDTLYGFGFAGLFALCFALRERGWSLSFLTRLRPLGDLSYTLYVTHLPVLVLISGWLMARNGETKAGLLPTHFGWMAAGAGFCLLLAWAAHFVVERPFVRRQSAL